MKNRVFTTCVCEYRLGATHLECCKINIHPAPEGLFCISRNVADKKIEFIRELQPKMEHPECPLTSREIDILRLVANGHTNSQVAQLLKISPQTVHTHLKNIYEKVHARNRMEASNQARNWGILG